MSRAPAILALALVLVPILGPSGRGRAEPASREHRGKAEFLERFTRFIDWPAGALGPPEQPFVIAVIGANPFGDYLDRLARDRRIQGRRVAVRYVSHAEQLAGAHLVFVARDQRANLAGILEVTAARPVLTIGDGDGFAARGTLLGFYVDGRYVRFEFNLPQIRRSGLAMRGRLLRLGRQVGVD